MKKLINFILLGLISSVMIVSCVDKDFDEPDFPFTDPDIETNSSISEVKALLTGNKPVVIEQDLIFDAVVIANDSLGNFYKKIVVQDETGGVEVLINMRSLYGKFPVGRKLFFKAKGLVLGSNKGVIQMGGLLSGEKIINIPSADVDNYIVGGSLKNAVEPKVMKICEFTKDDISTLIQFKDVQFEIDPTQLTYADGVAKADKNKTLVDCDGNQFIIRTSGYAEFAGDTVSNKKGTLTCVLGIYKYDDQDYECKKFQGYIRSTGDVDFQDNRCGQDPGEIKFNKNFNDGNLYSGGWTTQAVVGTTLWKVGEFNGEKFGKASNYSGGGNSESDTWLISPAADLSAFENPALSFRSASNYNGADMEVYISDSYDGISVPNVADWSLLNADLSGGSFAWVPSGNIQLAGYEGKTVYIAFRYLGSDSDGKTWEVDDIELKEYEDAPPAETKFDKDFEDGNINSGGWTTQAVVGSTQWKSGEYNGEKFGKASNYSNGANSEADAWLISPATDLSEFENPALAFRSASNYSGADMEVYISDSYDGTSTPDVSAWTKLSATLSGGAFEWVESGDIQLSGYEGKTVYIAFRYLGSDSDGKTWEVDDIKLKEYGGGGSTGEGFSDDFESGIGQWTTYSVKGDQEWTHSPQYGNPDGCVKMSGYADGGSNENEDWLITPQIDLTGSTDLSLTFDNATKYNGNVLEGYISTDYSGSGDPTGATWTQFTFDLSEGEWKWVSSGNIDLSAYADQKIYIGFKYTSTDSGSATWEIDNVVVK